MRPSDQVVQEAFKLSIQSSRGRFTLFTIPPTYCDQGSTGLNGYNDSNLKHLELRHAKPGTVYLHLHVVLAEAAVLTVPFTVKKYRTITSNDSNEAGL